ncbi:MAG: hypothetical protein ACOCZB_06265 [Spirochaetota bacterium]
MHTSNNVEEHISTRFGVSNLLDGLSFERFCRAWSLTHAGVVVVLVEPAEIAETQSIALAILGAWMAPALGLLIVEAADFFDGRIARRPDAGTLDAIRDSCGLRHCAHLCPATPPGCGDVRPGYRAHAAPAVIVSAMIGAMVPAFASVARTVVLLVVSTMQLVSFGWDYVLHSKAPDCE